MLGELTDIIDQSLCPPDWPINYEDLSLSADVWAEKILQQADELGFETVFHAKYALVRALAARRGYDSKRLTPYPFSRRWK
jgi:hypothetical protein